MAVLLFVVGFLAVVVGCVALANGNVDVWLCAVLLWLLVAGVICIVVFFQGVKNE